MTNVSSRSSLAALGFLVVVGCAQSSTTSTTTTTQEPLIVNRSQGGGLGFYFLPPISWSVPSHFGGVFDPDLSPTVRIDQIDPATGATLSNVATMTGDAHTVRRHPWREFYIARFDTSVLSTSDHYRVRVLIDDNELGAADLAVVKSLADLRNVDTTHFAPVMQGEILPVKFRIERSAADQDGDGVPDWRDNCPTIYNPPVPVLVLTPPGPIPPHCDYNKSACDPGERDCLAHVVLEQPDVCSCPNNGASCPAPDACHVATTCDPTTGACDLTAAPDGTSCSDGNACNGAETCQGGVCTSGPAPACGAAGPCTADSCDPIDGCKTVNATDGTACDLANGTGTCTSGACGVASCSAGFGDCDGNASNGCEDDVSSDVNNCGACGNVCAPSCEATVFTENWESGTGAWRVSSGPPIALFTDGTACDLFQRESVSGSGGRAFTVAGIAVNAGATYCLSAWIRGTTDAVPFLGLQISDAAGDLIGGEHWLIGLSGYGDGYGGAVTPVTSDGNWAWYSKSFTIEAGVNDVVLKDENFNTGSADFDMIQLFAGECPAAPTSTCAAPAPSCQAAICTSGTCASAKL